MTGGWSESGVGTTSERAEILTSAGVADQSFRAGGKIAQRFRPAKTALMAGMCSLRGTERDASGERVSLRATQKNPKTPE